MLGNEGLEALPHHKVIPTGILETPAEMPQVHEDPFPFDASQQVPERPPVSLVHIPNAPQGLEAHWELHHEGLQRVEQVVGQLRVQCAVVHPVSHDVGVGVHFAN